MAGGGQLHMDGRLVGLLATEMAGSTTRLDTLTIRLINTSTFDSFVAMKHAIQTDRKGDERGVGKKERSRGEETRLLDSYQELSFEIEQL
jgi:hypothetical protein